MEGAQKCGEGGKAHGECLYMCLKDMYLKDVRRAAHSMQW
jgi:hypothetical protein